MDSIFGFGGCGELKLKDGMVMEKSGEDFVAVATGEAGKSFNGLIRNNKTADFLFRELQSEKTEDELVQALLQKYEVSEELARKDVRRIVGIIRDAGLLDG